jgi:hypothetical protein
LGYQLPEEKTMSPLLMALALLVIVIFVYFMFVRPWALEWGATQFEVARPLTGDDVVQCPHFVATRAVTIEASPAEVWKWILQIGSARAGWYSLDWIDNAGVESSREILPQFQKIETGDFIPFTPDQKNGMWVKDFLATEHLLWWDKKGHSSWLWQLDEVEPNQTRLLTRLRTQYDFSFPWIIYYILYDFGDLLMMAKCLLGIKERAEARGV